MSMFGSSDRPVPCLDSNCKCDAFDGVGYCSRSCKDGIRCLSRVHVYSRAEQRANAKQDKRDQVDKLLGRPFGGGGGGGATLGGGGGGGNFGMGGGGGFGGNCLDCRHQKAVPGKDLCAGCFQRLQALRFAAGGGGAGPTSNFGPSSGPSGYGGIAGGGGGMGAPTSSTGAGGIPGFGYPPAMATQQQQQHQQLVQQTTTAFASSSSSSATAFNNNSPMVGRGSNCQRCNRSAPIEGTVYCQFCSKQVIDEYRTQVVPALAARSEHVRFYERNAPFYELTNFFPCEITFKGKVYPQTEALFQAAKFFDYAPQVAEQIRRAPGPRQAFDLAHANHHFERKDWLDVRDAVMLEALRLKFAGNPHLMAALLVTDPLVLIEHTTNDKYWGNNGDDTGVNRLGSLLMQVRHEVSTGALGQNYVSQGWAPCTVGPAGPAPSGAAAAAAAALSTNSPSAPLGSAGEGLLSSVSNPGFAPPHQQQQQQQQQFNVVSGHLPGSGSDTLGRHPPAGGFDAHGFAVVQPPLASSPGSQQAFRAHPQQQQFPTPPLPAAAHRPSSSAAVGNFDAMMPPRMMGPPAGFGQPQQQQQQQQRYGAGAFQ